MIHARQLSRHYGESTNRVTALDGIDLKIESGARVGILGRSGSGKTTLLNLLAGLDRPTAGSLSVADKNLDKLPAIELAQYRRETVGVVFQSFQLIPNRSAFQNVELPLILAGMERAERKKRVAEAIDRSRADTAPPSQTVSTFRRRATTSRRRPGDGYQAERAAGG